MTKTRAVGWVGFSVTGVVVGLITLTPQSDSSAHGSISAALLRWLHAVGVPSSFGPAQWEFTANIVMFVPLGFFLALALPLGRRRWALGILPLMSVAIESSQFFFLPSRFAMLSDIVANSLGGWIGVGLGVLAWHAGSRVLLGLHAAPKIGVTD